MIKTILTLVLASTFVYLLHKYIAKNTLKNVLVNILKGLCYIAIGCSIIFFVVSVF